ncbi:hypothetical protein NFI95_04230 [Acetobacteraceae bacterium KSS8]|uniref:rRNA-processing protein n=1 Tax=Endosaccharibacter trunci TaxID=2812733 RepID=A0ABT1W448_9PROT|nr:hypothetical protein [Acetobacteraceae bacterium KSS8]
MMFGKKNKRTAGPLPASEPVAKRVSAKSRTVVAPVAGKGSGKLAYETRRAEKAGMGLEKWMAEKDRRARAEREAIAEAKRKADAGRKAEAAKPGLLRRLLDRAHKPI